MEDRRKPGAVHHVSDWLRKGDKVRHVRSGDEGIVTALGPTFARVKMETGNWAGDEDPFWWGDLELID